MGTVQEEENKKNACTGCLTLEKKVQTLEEKIANVEKLFQLQSCNTRDISSPYQEELLQGSSTPTTTTRNARHDHCYISSPRCLRRKLDFTRSQKIMIDKIATYELPIDTPGLNHIIVNAVFANLVAKNLFLELRNHMFDTSEEENHLHSLKSRLQWRVVGRNSKKLTNHRQSTEE